MSAISATGEAVTCASVLSIVMTTTVPSGSCCPSDVCTVTYAARRALLAGPYAVIASA